MDETDEIFGYYKAILARWGCCGKWEERRPGARGYQGEYTILLMLPIGSAAGVGATGIAKGVLVVLLG